MNDQELNRSVSFPSWVEALASAPGLGPERRDAFRHAIMGYLHYLKEKRERASLASAKAYFDGEKRAGRDSEEAREAVRWFFREARKSGARGSRFDCAHRRESGGTGGGENAQRSSS